MVDCNRLVLCGRIAQRDALRYTPAGIPIVDFRLAHASEQAASWGARRAECELPCVAADRWALVADRLQIGDRLRVEGFLTRRHHRSQQLILEVNRIETDFEE
ncbi:MAG: primosomal replication protein N [Betaproteobacteria bacterium]|nr:primosomal replication protein N [Betaproteobacteria bacterium]